MEKLPLLLHIEMMHREAGEDDVEVCGGLPDRLQHVLAVKRDI
jgi:hypothetical protein